MKYCKDCKHFIYSVHEEFCRCAAIVSTSPVTGGKTGAYCAIERQSVMGLCGPDGKLFKLRKEMIEAH